MSEVMIGKITILPPYVEPEHRFLIEKAESMLSEYEELLITKIKGYYNRNYHGVKEPSQVHIKMMEHDFYKDKMRIQLLKELTNIKIICEKPRFHVNNQRSNSEAQNE